MLRGKGRTFPQPGGEVARGGAAPYGAGLRRRVVRFLLIVIVIIETLGKKGHSETLGIAGTADEEERETHQQHQQHAMQNV
jgi:hypothetical protein